MTDRPARLSCDQGRLWFDPVTSRRIIPIINSGGAPLRVTDALLTGPHAGDFRIVAEDLSGVDLYPETTCFLELAFAPAGSGERHGVLLLITNDPDGPHRIGLIGAAPELDIDGDDGDLPVIRQRLAIELPVAVQAETAVGEVITQCSNPRLLPRADGSRCELRVRQLVTVEVPVTITLTAECGQEHLRRETCHVILVQPVEMDLPLWIDATAELKPSCPPS